MAFGDALYKADEGIKANGRVINDFRFADDALLIAGSEEELQALLDRIILKCKEYGLLLNVKKTKYMVISKSPVVNSAITADGVPLERVSTMTYLGCQLNEQWDHSKEIRIRIEKARSAFIKMKNVFCSHNLSIDLRMRILRCYVFPILLYGVEAWTLSEASGKRLEAFEMWLYRRMLKISWTDHVANIEVLRRMRKCKEVLPTVKIRKLEYFGHIIRHPERYSLLKLVLEGKIEGKRGPGRRRISWLKNLRQWFNKSTKSLFRSAADKVKLAIMVANIRTTNTAL